MKVYIAGPMTGYPKFNFPAFDEMATWLRKLGHEVVSPSELDAMAGFREIAMQSEDGIIRGQFGQETWGTFLARDVKLIADEGIEAIVVLPGWSRSKGARLETFVAHLGGRPTMTYEWTGRYTDSPYLRMVPLHHMVEAWAGDDAWADTLKWVRAIGEVAA